MLVSPASRVLLCGVTRRRWYANGSTRPNYEAIPHRRRPLGCRRARGRLAKDGRAMPVRRPVTTTSPPSAASRPSKARTCRSPPEDGPHSTRVPASPRNAPTTHRPHPSPISAIPSAAGPPPRQLGAVSALTSGPPNEQVPGHQDGRDVQRSPPERTLIPAATPRSPRRRVSIART